MSYFFFEVKGFEVGILITDSFGKTEERYHFSGIGFAPAFAAIFNNANAVLVCKQLYPHKANFLNELIDGDYITDKYYKLLDLDSIMFERKIEDYLEETDIMKELEQIKRTFFKENGHV